MNDTNGKRPVNTPATGAGHGGPASGYKWPPLQPGHELRLVHGARSRTDRYADPITRELVEALLEERPELAAYPEALRAWARAEARCLLYADFHAKAGAVDEDGNLRGGQHVHAVERQAQRMRERLGLDPLADAELRKTQADAVHAVADLEGIRARGRAAIERRRELEADTSDSAGPGGDAA